MAEDRTTGSGPGGVDGVEACARRARAAALALAATPIDARNAAIAAIRRALAARRDEILDANATDRAAAAAAVAEGRLAPTLERRLDLSGSKFQAMLDGLDDVERLDDPVGRITLATELDEGLELYRVTSPIGVIGVIFEARPEAAVQIAALCLKSTNAVILKGGSEAARSNEALIGCIRDALAEVPGVPVDAVQLLATREEVRVLLDQDRWVDLIIPRGSNELVRSIQENTRIPVLGHADGICAVYLDRAADPERAARIAVDAKTQYPAVCNACETLLVHADLLGTAWPVVAAALGKAGVELRCDERAARAVAGRGLRVIPAIDEDWDTEFLDLRLAVKTVDSIDEAIEHINHHGSHHTDAIVTEDADAARAFLARVDSAGVYHNASTRFADGFRYGFGAEVGVSTNKTHARGPVGLDGLVIYKYRLLGRGQIVGDYGAQGRSYTHRALAEGEWRPEP